MKRNAMMAAMVALATTWTTATPGQTTRSATQPAGVTTMAGADTVAATVNGHAIMEGDIDKTLMSLPQAKRISKRQLAMTRQRMRPQILSTLIENRLLDVEVERAGISIAEEELVAKMESLFEEHLVRNKITREEYAGRIQSGLGQSLEQFLADRAADPLFRQSFSHTKLIERKFPEDVSVSDEDVKKDYEKDLPRLYTQQAEVRASHILIKLDRAADQQKRGEARKEIEAILAEARKPGADFAALAREHSGCPSAAKGGDLGSFPRKGAMVEPFAAAAFALDVGQISDVVETQFGYHVITVTGRKEAAVVPLEAVRDSIRDRLKQGRIQTVRIRYIADLKKTAKIVYSGAPPSSPATTRPARRPQRPPAAGVPTTKPAKNAGSDTTTKGQPIP